MTYIYSSVEYATAYSHIETVIKIESLGIWANVRPIPGTTFQDASAIYPLCWPIKPFSKRQLRQELNDLGLISLVLVTDPFMTDVSWFKETFDYTNIYKTHFTIEDAGGTVKYSKHHRYYVRKALRYCETKIIPLSEYLTEWQGLYDTLIKKHNLTRLHRFSPQYFQSLAQLPQFTVFGAFIDGELVSASIWAEHDGWVTGHLSATSDLGYSHDSSYAVFDHMIHHYVGSNSINLGGMADVKRPNSNLGSLKKGFSNATRNNWICGVIADADCYANLARNARVDANISQYFPAYRQP